MLFSGSKSPSDNNSNDNNQRASTNGSSSTSAAAQVSIFHPKTILLAMILTGGALGSYHLYQTLIKRIPTSLDIPTHYFRKKTVPGVVSSVGDGDNFHFFHTPGGIFAGWGWLRHPPRLRKLLKDQTWSVRLCGVDAPERSHFGKPAQPHSEESLQWLRKYLLHRKCKVKPLRIDQYNRVVAKVLVKQFGVLTRDVSEEMIKNGIGIVYEGKHGSEFDGQEGVYRRCEAEAKKLRKGLWQIKGKTLTPGEYKRLYK